MIDGCMVFQSVDHVQFRITFHCDHLGGDQVHKDEVPQFYVVSDRGHWVVQNFFSVCSS